MPHQFNSLSPLSPPLSPPSQVYAKKRVISTPKEAHFWMSVEAGDLEAVASHLHEDPSLVNLPNTTAQEEGHLPVTYAAHKGDHYLLHLLLLCSAMVNAPGTATATAA